jgi:hypothetical protein
MDGRGRVLRVDVAAASAMLLAGVSAQAAMWKASESAHDIGYPARHFGIAALLFVSVAGLTVWSFARDSKAASSVSRFALTAAKIVACVVLLAAFVDDGSLNAFRHEAHRSSTAVGIGAVLLVVQLVQSASVMSRRDIALGAPVVLAMLAHAGMTTHDARPAAAFVVALIAMVAAVTLVYRGELHDESTLAVKSGLLSGAGSPVARVILAAAVI